ncbi:glycosyltransferase 52 family protein [Vibrio sp. SM6]|uniref:Glycosyltransferase 52 family protein n=1 Tax=Vibrio agarilyticus TaxID=2726741 RepID=A0A7X8YHG5_9VIBR|nr:polysialyltransferase family glycosyltransferase [Vibrio agarilyticus]NLS13555.1 glycosyltransferase 52 family protein [Vibrio agarilyticus]
MNLFLVTSPLQYVLALEAKAYFGCQDCLLLLVNQDKAQGIAQQDKLLDFSDWTHVIQIDRTHRSFKVPQAIKKIKKIIQQRTIERFFYAEYNSWRTKLMIKNLPIAQEIYFDDGTMTLREYPKYIYSKAPFYRPRLIQDWLIRLQGCKPIGHLAPSEHLELFTMFDLDPTTHTVHKNTLERLKAHYGHPNLYNTNAPIGYIGQGAIGDKYQKSIKQYVQELEELTISAKHKILYFPHRTERKEVREALERNENIIYHQSEYPLEIELIDKGIKLSGFVGTYSTVMFTCRLLYPTMPIYTVSDDYPDPVLREELRRQFNAINVKKIEGFEELSC